MPYEADIRRKAKRADYLLRYRPDLTIAVVNAKASAILNRTFRGGF